MTGTPATTDTRGMTVTLATTVVMIAMLAKTVVGKKSLPTENAPAPHPVARNSTIVAPGRHPPRGTLMKGDLQGTMIDEERMITEENLTLILIAAGTTAGARRGNSTGLPEPMEITVGRVEV